MASSTVYRFRIEVSDTDRGFYDTLDFRVALHPSETPIFLVTRVLAYALNAQDDLAFSSGGLSDPDTPCLSRPSENGGFDLWIEVGSPSARRLHKASKAAREVKVYTYKDPEPMLKELASEHVHRIERIALHSLDPRFLERLAEGLEKDNRWGLMRTEDSLIVTWGSERTEQSELRTHRAG